MQKLLATKIHLQFQMVILKNKWADRYRSDLVPLAQFQFHTLNLVFYTLDSHQCFCKMISLMSLCLPTVRFKVRHQGSAV